MIHVIKTSKLPPSERWRRFVLSDSKGFYGRYERWPDGIDSFMKVVGRVLEWASQPCQHEGCTVAAGETVQCYLPDTNWQESPPDEWLCPEHAFAHGYCKGCGSFWAGVEDFDFGNGYCEHCQAEFDHDHEYEDEGDYYGDYWDDYEPYDEVDY